MEEEVEISDIGDMLSKNGFIEGGWGRWLCCKYENSESKKYQRKEKGNMENTRYVKHVVKERLHRGRVGKMTLLQI